MKEHQGVKYIIYMNAVLLHHIFGLHEAPAVRVCNSAYRSTHQQSHEGEENAFGFIQGKSFMLDVIGFESE